MSYPHAFKTEYGVSFFDARINFILDEKILSNFLSSYSRSTYIRYVQVKRLALRHYNLRPLCKYLSEEGATSQTIGVTHVDDAAVYNTMEEVVMLMIPVAKYFVENQNKCSPFHSLFFYILANLFSKELRCIQILYVASTSLLFAEFLQKQVPKTRHETSQWKQSSSTRFIYLTTTSRISLAHILQEQSRPSFSSFEGQLNFEPGDASTKRTGIIEKDAC